MMPSLIAILALVDKEIHIEAKGKEGHTMIAGVKDMFDPSLISLMVEVGLLIVVER